MNLNKGEWKEVVCLTKCAISEVFNPFLHTMVKQNLNSFHGMENFLKLGGCFKILQIGRKAEGDFS
jgi:hypothetical protein